jgi:predicted enzyme related to lactoylglutathione lyase
VSRPVHFEIHAGDPERAARFYRTVLGWSVEQWGDQPYWIVVTGAEDQPGINGGLLPRRGPAPESGQPVNAFVLTVQVEDLDATLASAAAEGATTALEKDFMAGVGWIAYVHDPEGNLLGLLQPEEAGAVAEAEQAAETAPL